MQLIGKTVLYDDAKPLVAHICTQINETGVVGLPLAGFQCVFKQVAEQNAQLIIRKIQNGRKLETYLKVSSNANGL